MREERYEIQAIEENTENHGYTEEAQAEDPQPEASQENSYDGAFGKVNEENGTGPVFQPQEPEDKKKHSAWIDLQKNKKLAKRAAALVLSGVLVGTAAGASFAAVNHFAGGTSEKVAASAPTLQTAAAAGDGITQSQSLDVSDIADAAMPSIVSITNKSVQEVENYFDMFGMGGYTQEQEVENVGSGIIVGENDTELLIVTNNHVIENADTLSVSFVDNEVCEAVVKGTDSENDLAVVAVNLSDIKDDTMSQVRAIQVGDSDSLKVGEQVVAIGNALGYGQSVTTGIVSASDRQIDGVSCELIQTDAAINPGNSGGALLNMQGQLVGINSAKLASTEVEGMGYAIPVSVAQPIMENLMSRETREKVSDDQAASIGIQGVDVSSETAETYGMPQGAYVASVNEGSAAEKAGLKEGMIITKFDGTSISSMSELKNQLAYYAAGETVTITAEVADNGEYKEQELEITLDSADQIESTEGQNAESFQQNFQGFQKEGLW